MASRYWTGGANDGVFMTAGNWSDASAPQNNDTHIVGATAQNIHGAATGLTGVTIKFLPGYSGIVGDDGPLTTASAALIEYAGSGASANLGCVGTVTDSNFNHTAGVVTLSSGTWTAVNNGTGGMIISAATVVTTGRNVAGTWDVGYNGTAFTLLESGGQTRTHRSCTTLTVMRGTTTQRDNGTTTYTLCTTVNIHNGGTYNKQSGGTDVTINGYPGSLITIVGTSGGSAGTVAITTYNKYAGAASVLSVPGLTIVPGTSNYRGANGTSD
jgi:hypothetical protein